MGRIVSARPDRSMSRVREQALANDLEPILLALEEDQKRLLFQEILDMETVSYRFEDLNTSLIGETLHFRHIPYLLAVKSFGRHPNLLRLNPIRLNSFVKELQQYGEVKLINFIGDIDAIPDNICLKVEHPTNHSKDLFIFLSEKTDLEPTQYPDYKNDIMGDLVITFEIVQVQVDIDNIEAEKFLYEINKRCDVEISDNEVYVEMIVQTAQGLTTQRVRFEFEYGNDLDLHYGEGFSQFHEKLIERVNSRDKGIVMFHGPPGNGKTHYIRRLLPDLNKGGKRVILIPKHILESLESPNFNLFMLQHFVGQKIVFIMEDAESIISKRSADGGGRSQLVSTLLNITDGILNDIFSIQVILTFNTALTSIDEALQRKGRLIAKYEFKSIGRKQAEKLAEHLSVSLGQQANKEEFSLAEIYALKETEEDDLLINQNLESKKEPLGF